MSTTEIEKKSKITAIKNKAGVTNFLYAKVGDRIKAAHQDRPESLSITTEHTIHKDSKVYSFRATVTIDKGHEVKTKDGEHIRRHKIQTYTGTAFGSGFQDKAFEKIETVAVGRALALAGYLSDGDVASSDEIDLAERRRSYTESIINEITSGTDGIATEDVELSKDDETSKEGEQKDQKDLSTIIENVEKIKQTMSKETQKAVEDATKAQVKEAREMLKNIKDSGDRAKALSKYVKDKGITQGSPIHMGLVEMYNEEKASEVKSNEEKA